MLKKLIFDKQRKGFAYTENYLVPGGFVIAIVFPKSYVPISIEFGEKTMIPIGGREVADSSGSFEISYDSAEKILTLIFTVYSNTNFQFSCCGLYSPDAFPSSINNFKGDLDAVVKINPEINRAIEGKDLQKFKEYFKEDTKLVATLLMLIRFSSM